MAFTTPANCSDVRWSSDKVHAWSMEVNVYKVSHIGCDLLILYLLLSYMARRRAATRQHNAEDFSEELQNIPSLEPVSDDEDDESYEPVRLPRRNVNRTMQAAGTTTNSSAPDILGTATGTITDSPAPANTRMAGDTSDHPPPVILNDPDEGSGSQKVRPTEDLAWFFNTDDETGMQTCKVCRYVIIISMVSASEESHDNDKKLAGKQTPNHTYWKGTGNTNLWGHLDRNHNALYIQQAGILRWENKLPSFRSQQSSFGQTDHNFAGSPGLLRPDNFSVEKLHRSLIKFIMADDQVRVQFNLRQIMAHTSSKSICVLECPEFRDLLLLLHSNLKDFDIPC